jgi:secretion/DNA translocation related TadE-like protein
MRRTTGIRAAGRRREEGSATVLALAALVALLTVVGVFATAGRAALLRQGTANAADFAALAAAAEPGPATTRCRRAAALAEANDAQLTACDVTGEVVSVTVRRPLPTVFGRGRALVASARAGPADASEPGDLSGRGKPTTR